MRLYVMGISLILANMISCPAISASEQSVADEGLMSRISLSFSGIPFNAQPKDVKMRLTQIRNLNCTANEHCSLWDKQHVRHYFDGPQNQLSKKGLKIFDYYYDKPIAALDIGLARDKISVSEKITAFLGGVTGTCVEEPLRGLKGYPSYTVEYRCIWTLNHGDVGAIFDNEGELEDVTVSLRTL